jgi:hypothetical protein
MVSFFADFKLVKITAIRYFRSGSVPFLGNKHNSSSVQPDDFGFEVKRELKIGRHFCPLVSL